MWGSQQEARGMSQLDFMEKDRVIVVNEKDEVVGSASKYESHRFVPGQPRGMLHRAFSVFMFDGEGKLLLQKRASDKITFPGVWTNTCCSHQLTGCDPSEVDDESGSPGDAPLGARHAAVRKLQHELGIDPKDVPIEKFKFLTRLHYYAADSVTHGKHSVWGEHEVDYILFIQLDSRPKMEPHPEEVEDIKWVTPKELEDGMADPGLLWSPWFCIIARRWLLPLWWKDGNPENAKAHVDVETVHAFDPPAVHRSGAGICGLLNEGENGAAHKKKQGAYGKIPLRPKESKWRSMLRVDEIFLAAYYMLSIEKGVDANLDLSSPDVQFLNDVLGRVSRSFAAVIRQLPESLCLPVVVFYIALRGLDTVEDDMQAFKSPADKIYCLQRFHETLLVGDAKGLLSGRPSLEPFFGESVGGMKGVGEGDEAMLLEKYDIAGRVFNSLPKASREVIADITRRMGYGMAEFVERDLGQGTVTVEDYNLYCHYVAGLVGEGLSRLFVATGCEGPELVGRALPISNSMGLFLQKTNIIRDYLEDYVDGRAFWPQAVWKKYTKTGQLGEFILPQNRDSALACLNELVTDALELVPECFEYMALCKHPQVFKFCAIPQIMAIATLTELYNNHDVFAGVVKIRKGLAIKMILASDDMASVAYWFGELSRSIERVIPSADPSASRTRDACEKIDAAVRKVGGAGRTATASPTALVGALAAGVGAAAVASHSSSFPSGKGVAVALGAVAAGLIYSSLSRFKR